MKNQEKVEASAAIADAIANLPSERAQKKAARRAAFIQEVAVAVVERLNSQPMLVYDGPRFGRASLCPSPGAP